MKKMIALSALLASGCASWKPDGQIAGVLPVDALEQSINMWVPGVGTALVTLDKQARPSAHPVERFKLESVSTVYRDAKDQEIFPPFRRIETPTYADRVTELPEQLPAPAAKLDAAAILKAIQAAQQASPAPAASIPTGPITDAEKAALEALGVK